jgi:glutathione S-transferase
MQGQLNHFNRFAPEKVPYAQKRYHDETLRLYGVLESQLERQEESHKSPYLVGDKLTIADITTYGWVHIAAFSGVDIDQFPRLKRWEEVTVGGREAVKRGFNTPPKVTDQIDKAKP